MTSLKTAAMSPYATGGGGVDFETEVATYYLAAALTRSIARGLPDAIVQLVVVQARAQGEPLDDIIIHGERSDGSAKLALQAKHAIGFTEHDAEFPDIVRRVWETISASDFRIGVDAAGVAIGVNQRAVDEYHQRVLTWARTAVTGAEFITRIGTKGRSHEKQRTFVQTVRVLLTRVLGRDATDDEVWRFCQAFVILHFDFQTEGSRDMALTEATLRVGLPLEDAPRAVDLRKELITEAMRLKRSGGTATTDSLLTLTGGRFAIREAIDVRRSLHRLSGHAELVLGDINRTIAGVSLPRTDVVAAAHEAVDAASMTLIVGPPGSGKSAILTAMYDEARREGAVLLVSGERLFGAGWDAFAQGIGVVTELRDILMTAGASMTPTIFIDGIDRAETTEKRRVVNDLLRVVGSVNVARSRPWRIVATVREQNVQAVLEWAAVPREAVPRIIAVSNLTTVEVSVLIEPLPQLRAIAFDPQLSAVTHNPFMLDRLTDPRILQNLPSGALTEVTLATVWWRHVVSDGTPSGRRAQQALIRIAEALLAGDVAAAALTDANALQRLEDDRIIVVDPTSSVPRLLHDIYEDWTLYHTTELRHEQLRAFVAGASQPFRLRRAVRLYGCALLEQGDVDEWKAALIMFESDPALAARWRFAFLSSPLLSVRSDELLAGIRELLFADNGRRLVELLRAARTIEVAPNLAVVPALAVMAEPGDEMLELLMHQPQPRWSIWIALLRWLLAQSDLPTTARGEAARIFELWQVQTPDGAIHRGAVADRAWEWLWDNSSMTFARREDEAAYYARLRRILLRSADVRPNRVKELLGNIADNYWHDSARDQLLNEAESAAKHVGPEYVKAVLKILLPRRNDDDRDSWHLDYGFPHIRDMFPAAHVRPPFITVLRANEAEGLRLIHALANTAIDRWRRQQLNEWNPIGTPVPLTVTFPWGTQEFWGGPHEYLWFRGNGTGPHAVVSALMALEYWAEEQLSNGRDAEELFQTVLSESRCIAVTGLCAGLALAFPDKCLRAALPLVSRPLMWLLDVQRAVQDMSGTVNVDPTGRDEFINKLRKNRDDRPQRRIDIRALAPRYLFGGDEALTERFSAAVARFSEDIPIRYEEQRDSTEFIESTRRTLVRFQAAATQENYRVREAEEGIYLEVEMPNAIVEQDAPDAARMREEQSWMTLWMWGEHTIRNGVADDSMTPEAALDRVRTLFRAELFRAPFEYGAGPDAFLLQGVAASAAALAFACTDTIRGTGDYALIRDVILAAAAMPEGDIERNDPRIVLSWHPRAYAGRGLGALARDGDTSVAVREAYLRISGSIAFTTVTAASAALSDVWRSAPDLAWRAIVLTVTLSRVSPWVRGGNPAHEVIVEESVAALRKDIPVALPRIGPEEDFYFHVFSAGLSGVPIEALLRDAICAPSVRKLLEDLVAWTLAQHTDTERAEQLQVYEWTFFFSDLLAVASGALDNSAYSSIISSYVASAWQLSDDADLVPRYLAAFLDKRLSLIGRIEDCDVARWHDLVTMTLATDDVQEFQDDYRAEQVTKALSLLVFVQRGANFFTERWPHAQRFEEDITQWVSTVAHIRRAYRWLLVFLERFSGRFPVAVVLRWLCLNGDASPPVDMFADGDTGDRLAGVLLRIWKHSRPAILADVDMERRYASMIDHLLLAGITIANVLAERLARRE